MVQGHKFNALNTVPDHKFRTFFMTPRYKFIWLNAVQGQLNYGSYDTKIQILVAKYVTRPQV